MDNALVDVSLGQAHQLLLKQFDVAVEKVRKMLADPMWVNRDCENTHVAQSQLASAMDHIWEFKQVASSVRKAQAS